VCEVCRSSHTQKVGVGDMNNQSVIVEAAGPWPHLPPATLLTKPFVLPLGGQEFIKPSLHSNRSMS